jgi:hypothetical protein
MFGLFGAAWMIFVLYLGSSLLVSISDYPGILLAQWARNSWLYYRGGSPGSISSESVWIKIWLVMTSALEWMVLGLIVLAIVQGRSKNDVDIE